MRAVVKKSINVERTNSLHQFDCSDIIGVQTPVGKVPIMFYMRITCNSGRRGIIYFGDDRDSVCQFYPEDKHCAWCSQPYDMRYDKVETWDNGLEQGWHRNWGNFNLWVSVLRTWYNGTIMYRPEYKVKNCHKPTHGYPRGQDGDVLTNKKIKYTCSCRRN